jgi:hypothetical protein
MRHKRFRHIFTGLMAAMFLSLTACGSSSASSGSGRPSPYGAMGDVCSLVTASEVGGIVGETVVPAKIDFHGVPTCKYAAGSDFIQTSVVVEQSPQTAQASFHAIQGKAARSVPGVGDAAAFDTIATLTVLKGNVILGITVQVGKVSDQVSAEKQIAQLLIGRLK